MALQPVKQFETLSRKEGRKEGREKERKREKEKERERKCFQVLS